MERSFKTSLLITDLNDYIKPSIECIKPTPKPEKADPTVFLDELVPVKPISLSDCLACSGCITSAEQVLVSQHSHETVLKNIKEADNVLLLISMQSLVSLSSKYSVPVHEMSDFVAQIAEKHMNARIVNVAEFQNSVLLAYQLELDRRMQKYPEFCSTCSVLENDANLRRRARIMPKKTPEWINYGFPLLCSACPGVTSYIEKKQPWLVPLLCPVLTPMGAAALQSNTYCVSVMPCHDMKLNAAREDVKVDTAITTIEFEMLVENLCTDAFKSLEPCPFVVDDDGPDTSSGGYTVFILENMLKRFNNPSVYKNIKNNDFIEFHVYCENSDLPVFSAACVYGFNNIQTLIRNIRLHDPSNGPLYHFVEVMACPNGCLNGGGQFPKPSGSKDWFVGLKKLFHQSHVSSNNFPADQLSTKFLGLDAPEPIKSISW